MSTQSLDLKLSDGEIDDLYEQYDGTTARLIADAATAKAAWGLVEWLKEKGYRTPSSLAHVELHYELQVAQGIQKPE